MRKSNCITVIGVCFLTLILAFTAGCSYSSPSQNALNRFTDDTLLVQQTDSYTNGPSVDKNGTSIKGSSKDFTGSYTIWNEVLDADTTIDISYSAKVQNGSFKIVFINSEDQVTVLWQNDEVQGFEDGISFYAEAEGTYRMKVVGIHTEASFNVEVDDVER